MADSEDQEAANLLVGDANLVQTPRIIQVSGADVGGRVEVSEDILQQALQEASGTFVDGGVSYVDDQVSVADAADVISLDGSTVINAVAGGDIIYALDQTGGTLVQDQNGVHDLQELVDSGHLIQNADGTFSQQVVAQPQGQGDGQHQAIMTNGDGNYVVQFQDPQQDSGMLQGQLVTTETHPGIVQSYQPIEPVGLHDADLGSQLTESNETPPTQTTTVVHAPTPRDENVTPLGSSTNPIRIVQQGNQYTSLQQLSSSQLSQIMQVVQQQQVMKGAETNKSSVLYNPQTQTRIVYKVIYPSELHNKTPNNKPGTSASSSGTEKKTPHQIYVPTESVLVTLPGKRTYRKRKAEDDEKAEAPELSKEEKEEKKKHRPRTRSGRVSRPPRHMVKDYKHIHPVDWDEDYDDSDGGYSDFKGSSGEGEDGEGEEGSGKRRRRRDANYTSYPVMGPHGKSKPWKCRECEKAYIGKAGLARHYRLIPEHGKDDENFKEGFFVNDGDDSISMDSMPDSAEQHSGLPLEQSPDKHETGVSTTTTDSATPSKAKMLTVKPASTTLTNGNLEKTLSNGDSKLNEGLLKAKQISSQKKKSRLKEFIREFSDEDLMEIVFPRLAGAVSTWEYMMMKVERGRPARPQLIDLLQEYVQVYRKIRRMSQDQLRSAVPGTNTGGMQIQISDENVARSLGLAVGLYSIHNPPPKEDTFHYKLLTTDPKAANTQFSQSHKRTVEAVSPQDMIQAKKPKLDSDKTHPEPVENILPGQTLLKASLLSSGRSTSSINGAESRMMNVTEDMRVLDTQTLTNTRILTSETTGSSQLFSQQEATPESQMDLASTSQDMDNDQNSQVALLKTEFVENVEPPSTIMSSDTSEVPTVNMSISQPVFNVNLQSTSLSTTSMATASFVQTELTGSSQLMEHPGQHLPAQLMEQPADDSEEQHFLGEPIDGLVKMESEPLAKHESQQLIQESEQSLEESSDMGQSSQFVEEPVESETKQLFKESEPDMNEPLETKQEAVCLTEQPNQLMEQTGSITQEADQFVEQPDQSMEQPVDVGIKSEQLTEQPEGDCDDLGVETAPQGESSQLDASQISSDTVLSLTPGASTFNNVHVESEMTQQFDEDGMILTDQGNGQLAVQENMLNGGVLVTANSDSQPSLDDPNNDNQLILIKNPDGTIQIHRQGNQPISLETLQALLGMELDINMVGTEPSDELLEPT